MYKVTAVGVAKAIIGRCGWVAKLVNKPSLTDDIVCPLFYKVLQQKEKEGEGRRGRIEGDVEQRLSVDQAYCLSS